MADSIVFIVLVLNVNNKFKAVSINILIEGHAVLEVHSY